MGQFRFKRFSVRDDFSAMKVNTDGVILGAVASLTCADRSILDVGTGTGTVALMLAQRSESVCSAAMICGIDVDIPSVIEASDNFSASPWPDRLTAVNVSLQDYCPQGPLDLIVSNPPFYDGTLTNPDQRLATARHNVSLSYCDIFRFAEAYLAKEGRVCVILPADIEMQVLREARSRGLFLDSILRVRTTPAKAEKRIVCRFTFDRSDRPSDAVLTIQENGAYTTEYLEMMRDFYLFA